MGRGARAAALLLTAALLAPANVSAAVADPAPAAAPTSAASAGSATLRARADALRARVEGLQLQAEVATEAYSTAETEVDAAVGAEVRAQTVLDAATGTSALRHSDATRRVRSLYMAGGAPVALSSVLAGGGLSDLHDVAARLQLARTVVTADAGTVSAAAVSAQDAAQAETRLTDVRERKVAAQEAADAARRDVESALAEQQGLLAAADRAVVDAVAAEQEQARRDALAQAAARATAAGVADAARASTSRPPASAPSTDAAPTDAPPTDDAGGSASAAIAAAWTRQGLPYVWGATGPSTFDCSGLTQWAYRQAGTSIPRTSRQQYAALPKVPLDALQPGDLVFYATGDDPSTIHHVALYLGGGRVLHAPHTGDVVREAGVAMPGLLGAVRPGAG